MTEPGTPKWARPHGSWIERRRGMLGTMGIVAKACWRSTLGLRWGVRAEGDLSARAAGDQGVRAAVASTCALAMDGIPGWRS
jgi:hypothetical protein